MRLPVFVAVLTVALLVGAAVCFAAGPALIGVLLLVGAVATWMMLVRLLRASWEKPTVPGYVERQTESY